MLLQQPQEFLHFLWGTCSIEKYSFDMVFNAPVKRTIDIKLGNVIIPRAASPKAQIASSSAMPPIKTNKT